jgi:hypothetical protein
LGGWHGFFSSHLVCGMRKALAGRGLFVGEVFLPDSKLAWRSSGFRGGFFQVVDLAGNIDFFGP